MSDINIDICVAKDYPFVLRLSKTSSQVKKNMFSQSVFMKDSTDTTFRDEFDLSTGMVGDWLEGYNLLETVKDKINQFLSDVENGTTQEELHDQQKMLVLWVKSKRQINLNDVWTDVDRVPTTSNKIGGTKHHFIPFQNSKYLITALSNIAFSDHVRENQYTQTTSFNSFVLDVLIKVRNKKLPVPKGPLGIDSNFGRSNDDKMSTITALSSSRSAGGRKRAHSLMDSETTLNINLVSPTWVGKVKVGGEKPLCFNKTHLGMEINIPPTGTTSGEGVWIGVVKRMLAEKAMLEKDYLGCYGDLAFDCSSQLFYSKNRGAQAIERFNPSTRDMWEKIKKQRNKQTHTHIDLVMSFRRKKLDSDLPQVFEYDSDYSEKLSWKELCERSPEKYDNRSEAVKRRDKKIAANSKDRPAESFITNSYENKDSPVYHGFSFEHATAMRKYLSVLKLKTKYIWEVYPCTPGNVDSW